MVLPIRRVAFPVVLAAVALFGTSGARAESMKACSAKYQAAKTAGTLNGQDWKDFRKAQCSGSGSAAATPAAATTPAAGGAAATAPAATPAAAPAPAGAANAAAKAASTTAASDGAATFPSKVDPKYASLTPGKARMKTCLDQYHANKSGGGNGGLKWIQKGGGYYSACSKHLKTA